MYNVMNYICISFNTKLVHKILRFCSLTLSLDLPAVLGSQFWDGLSSDGQLVCSLNWLCTIMSTHHSKSIVIENIYWFNFVIVTLTLYLLVKIHIKTLLIQHINVLVRYSIKYSSNKLTPQYKFVSYLKQLR